MLNSLACRVPVENGGQVDCISIGFDLFIDSQNWQQVDNMFIEPCYKLFNFFCHNNYTWLWINEMKSINKWKVNSHVVFKLVTLLLLPGPITELELMLPEPEINLNQIENIV